MNRNRYLLVFDYETDDSPDKIETLNIVQIAAVPIDLRNLEVLHDRIFAIDVCPEDLKSQPDYLEAHYKTIEWHTKQQNTNVDGVINRWREGVPERDAWEEFVKYTKSFSKGGRWDQTPIPGGQNIRGFDLPITKRYGQKFNAEVFFSKRDAVDLMDLTSLWFMFATDPPKSLSLDSLRDYFGIEKYGSHDAKKDVIDCADLIKRFLKVYEQCSPRIRWRSNVPQEV